MKCVFRSSSEIWSPIPRSPHQRPHHLLCHTCCTPQDISSSTLCLPWASLMVTEERPEGCPGEERRDGGVRRRRNRPQRTRIRSAGARRRGSMAEALSGVNGGGWRIGLLVGLLAASVRRVEVRVQRFACCRSCVCVQESGLCPALAWSCPQTSTAAQSLFGMGNLQGKGTPTNPQFIWLWPSNGSWFTQGLVQRSQNGKLHYNKYTGSLLRLEEV